MPTACQDVWDVCFTSQKNFFRLSPSENRSETREEFQIFSGIINFTTSAFQIIFCLWLRESTSCQHFPTFLLSIAVRIKLTKFTERMRYQLNMILAINQCITLNLQLYLSHCSMHFFQYSVAFSRLTVV